MEEGGRCVYPEGTVVGVGDREVVGVEGDADGRPHEEGGVGKRDGGEDRVDRVTEQTRPRRLTGLGKKGFW